MISARIEQQRVLGPKRYLSGKFELLFPEY
jgi:hypothetical protein